MNSFGLTNIFFPRSSSSLSWVPELKFQLKFELRIVFELIFSSSLIWAIHRYQIWTSILAASEIRAWRLISRWAFSSDLHSCPTLASAKAKTFWRVMRNQGHECHPWPSQTYPIFPFLEIWTMHIYTLNNQDYWGQIWPHTTHPRKQRRPSQHSLHILKSCKV